MANSFPIGTTQQLSSQNGLFVVFNRCDFSTDLDLIGYRRTIRKDYLKSVTHQINGTPNVKGVRHNRFFSFEWSLQLDQSRFDILYAMWMEQTDKVNTYSTDVGIKLFDARQVLLVRSNPRVRAKILGTPLPDDTPAPPVGYEYIWPICNIFITDLEKEPLILPNGLYKVRLVADELSVLSELFDE